MKRLLTLAPILLTACSGVDVNTYRESSEVDVCATTMLPNVDPMTRRPYLWRYHPCSNPGQTIAAGSQISPSVAEEVIKATIPAAGYVGAARILGSEIDAGHQDIAESVEHAVDGLEK